MSRSRLATGATLDSGALSKIANSIGEANSVPGTRATRARAVESNLAAARALEHEASEPGDADQPVIVLQLDGNFSILTNPNAPVKGSTVIALLNPSSMHLIGYFLTDRPGTLADLGTVVDVPLG
jgi:hypothetical protein